MMNFFKLRTLILIMLALANARYGYGQDSLKKAKPVPVKYIKPVNTPEGKTVLPVTKIPVTATTSLPGQNPAAESPAMPPDKSLRGQYQYLLTKVYNYQQPLVAALWKNYSDTLSIVRVKLKTAVDKLGQQTDTISKLRADITAKEQNLTASNAKVDEVSLLGIPLTKATYNWIMWGLVAGFGVIAAVIIARSGSYSREAKYRTKLYNELDEEYKTYKAKANEKEKKLARELQTERNKNDELTGNA